MEFAPRGANGWRQAILGASLASIGYAGLVTGYSAQSSAIQITGSVWTSFGLSVLFAFGTIGVPVLLWIHLRIRGPVILMMLVLLFWHVIVYLPISGTTGGDVPAFALVLFWAPIYLVAYGVIGGGEYWLRGRNVVVSSPSA